MTNGFQTPFQVAQNAPLTLPEWAIFPGLIHVTGDYDSGKTTFCLSCGAAPEKICFLDWDIKGRLAKAQLDALGTPLGAYFNLVELSKGKKEIEFHNNVMSILRSIRPGDFEALIFDTYSYFEATYHPWVTQNIASMRDGISRMGEIKGAQIWLASFDYETLVLDELLSKVPAIFLVTHLKNHTVGGHRSGKRIPDVKKPVMEKSAFRLWTVHANNRGGAPNGLVLKRISKLVFQPGKGIVPTNVLPYKLSPATWERIRFYWDNPLGERDPESNETMTQDEADAVSQNLTEFHRFVIQLEVQQAAKIQEEELKLAKQLELSAAKQAWELSSQGMPPAEIAAKLGVNVPKILGWLRAYNEHLAIQKEAA